MKRHIKYKKNMGILVSAKKIFKGFAYVSLYVKHVGPWAGPFLTPGLYFEQSC